MTVAGFFNNRLVLVLILIEVDQEAECEHHADEENHTGPSKPVAIFISIASG